jgi:LVIVD repeat
MALALPATAGAGHNPDRHSDNAALVGNFNDGGEYRSGSDLALWGNTAVLGNYDQPGGFRLVDISNPAAPTEIGQLECPGPQNDVSVWGDLVFVSVDSPRSAPECGAGSASPQQVQTGAAWEGIRVVSIANPATPVQLAAVDTPCGSHTHTLMPDEANGRVLIYVQSYPLSPQAPDCNPASHRKVSVVEVPLGDPGAAKISGSFDVSPAVGCHDSTVLMPRKLVGAACISESQMWDVSDPAKPRVISHIANPAINIQHSTTFSWDGNTLVIGDELGGAEFSPGCGPGGDHVPLGALWFYDVSDPARPAAKASYRIPQTELSVLCTAHNFNAVPLTNGKDILVSAWYNGGTTVLDFTDPTDPQQIAFYIAKTPEATTWSSYWYNDLVYGNNYDRDLPPAPSRGFDVMRFTHPSLEGALHLGRLNPQTMESLPAAPGVTSEGLVQPAAAAPACVDRIRPTTNFIRRTLRISRRGILLRGKARDRGCRAGGRGKVEQVLMALSRRQGGGRCRHLQREEHDPKVHLGPPTKCRTPYYGRAQNTRAVGTTRWRFRVRVKLPRGTYTIRSRALDSAANIEKKPRKAGKRRNFITVKVR